MLAVLRYPGIAITLLGLVLPACPAAALPASPGRAACERGRQALLDDHLPEAISQLQESLRLDPRLADAHLHLAAAFLGQGRDALAASHLEDYLRLEPDHHAARKQYAEILLRLGRLEAAQEQLEQLVGAVQDREELATRYLVDCHSRLMEIAGVLEDRYGQHLHRGIALYRLACERDALPENASPLSSEGLLCRAVQELTQAQQERPDEARPCWYLHAVLARLGQRQPANRWLRSARDTALLSYLTPSEQRGLTLACLQLHERPHR